MMKKLLIIFCVTLSVCAFGQKRKFNGILIGWNKNKYTLSDQILDCKQKLKRRTPDSLVYSFEFQDIENLETELLFTKNQIYIGTSITEVGASDYRFQKIMDFGLKEGESWTVDWLFCTAKSVITFEMKYLDNISNDSIYQFKLNSEGPCSHFDPINRIYGSKKLGLIRLDYFMNQGSFQKSIYERAIFVASDYIPRNKLKSLYQEGAIWDPK